MRQAYWLAMVAVVGCPLEVTVAVGPLPVVEEDVPPGPPGPELCEVEASGPPVLKLMTRAELGRTLRDLLGESVAITDILPPENSLLGFENDADNHQVSPVFVEAMLVLAETVAARAVSTQRDRVLPCASAVDDADCGRLMIEQLGRKAYRRPLADDERAGLQALFDGSVAAYGLDKAAEMTLTAMLSSPAFLYRPDIGAAAAGGQRLVTGYEMASRLSYFLWGTMPDDALLGRAEAGELDEADGVALSAAAMMQDARAKDGIDGFFRQWLDLDSLRSITKDAALFPSYQDDLRERWRTSVLRFVEAVMIDGDGRLATLLTSPQVHLDDALAPLYGVTSTAWTSFEAPDGPRAGLLSQPGLMALLANADQNSPIRRGVYVRERLLCQPISPPPPDLQVEAPNPDPALTTRERFAVHTAEQSCRDCHVLIDPVGFGFEHYDALGRYRSEENGRAIDASGELLYTGDDAVEGPFVGAVELGGKLANSRPLQNCAVDHLFRYAMGRRPTAADSCTVDQLEEVLTTSGSLRDVWLAVASSDAFRMTKGGVSP